MQIHSQTSVSSRLAFDDGPFSQLSSTDRQRLFALGETVRVKSGVVLFSEGEKTSCVYVIRKGSVELGHFEGNEWHARVALGVSDCLGDLNNRHDHSARATSTCELLKFDGVDMVHLLMEDPDLWCRLCQAVKPSLH